MWPCGHPGTVSLNTRALASATLSEPHLGCCCYWMQALVTRRCSAELVLPSCTPSSACLLTGCWCVLDATSLLPYHTKLGCVSHRVCNTAAEVPSLTRSCHGPCRSQSVLAQCPQMRQQEVCHGAEAAGQARRDYAPGEQLSTSGSPWSPLYPVLSCRATTAALRPQEAKDVNNTTHQQCSYQLVLVLTARPHSCRDHCSTAQTPKPCCCTAGDACGMPGDAGAGRHLRGD